MMKFILFFLIVFISIIGNAQLLKINGVVEDETTKMGIVNAKIVVKGSTQGVMSNDAGKFEIELDFSKQETYILEVREMSYAPQLFEVSKNNLSPSFTMKAMDKTFNDVVVSGTRISEKIMESPVSIQKLSAKELMATASGNFYEGLKNLRGVDISTSSAGFQAVNMRGFNTTSPVRIVQFVDGMDNRAPGLKIGRAHV